LKTSFLRSIALVESRQVGGSSGVTKKIFAYIRTSGYIGSMKEMTTLFKSLEDETRLRIMNLLLGGSELCVCHMIEVLQLPQSTVSRHLAILKSAGLLKDRRAGVWIHYSIKPDLSPTHQIFIEALHTVLENNDMARKDKKRLAKLGPANDCT
jgi:ArsR family transcriptional regulator